jgi:hypothetical protein
MIPAIAKLGEFSLDSVAALRNLDAKRHACLYLSEQVSSIESSACSLLSSHFASKIQTEILSQGYEPRLRAKIASQDCEPRLRAKIASQDHEEDISRAISSLS